MNPYDLKRVIFEFTASDFDRLAARAEILGGMFPKWKHVCECCGTERRGRTTSTAESITPKLRATHHAGVGGDDRKELIVGRGNSWPIR